MTTACFCQINREHIAKLLNKGHNSVNLLQLFLDLNSRNSIPGLYHPSKSNKITQVFKLTDTQTHRQDENIPLHNIIVCVEPGYYEELGTNQRTLSYQKVVLWLTKTKRREKKYFAFALNSWLFVITKFVLTGLYCSLHVFVELW